jgi:aryl-alcohol dehydrogenase-like predicted oxidoreductase
MGMSDFYGSNATRDDAESIATIRAALDAGITLLNTGDFYGSGHNELLIAEALRGSAHKPFISVKTGILRTPSGGFGGIDVRPQALRNFAAHTLTRLGVEAIGLYQPARLDPSIPVEDIAGTIADLIREGKVRYFGLSEASPEQLRRAHQVHPVAAVEVEYSLATRVIERELLGTARELGVGIAAYGVLSRGLLSGELPAQFHPADFRAHAPRFTGEAYAHNQQRVRTLHGLAAEKGCSAAQLAIAWVLHQGADILPLIGTTKRSRLAGNLGALEIQLSAADLQQLDQAFPDGAFEGSRYAEAQMGLVVR